MSPLASRAPLTPSSCKRHYEPACLSSAAAPWRAEPSHLALARLRCCALHVAGEHGLSDVDSYWRGQSDQLQELDENWRFARMRSPLIDQPLLVSDMLFARVASAVMFWDLKLRNVSNPGRVFIMEVQQAWLLPHALRRLRDRLVNGGDPLPAAVTVVAKDDSPQPHKEATRRWCNLSTGLAARGVRTRLFVQNLAVHAEGLAQPVPIGIFEAESLADFLATRHGQQAHRTAQRHNLLMCCCMKSDGAKYRPRALALESLRRNGFDCNKSSDLPPEELQLGKSNAVRKYDTPVKASLWQYFSALVHSKFVLAPYGHGRDSYRLWEALSCGAIPVLLRDRSYRLDHSKFDGLPVLWVESWEDVTPTMLHERWVSMNAEAHTYDLRRLHSPWWLGQLLQVDRSVAPDGQLAACDQLETLPARGQALEPTRFLDVAARGFCGFTKEPTDCEFADRGVLYLNSSERTSWQVAATACLRKCSVCARCRYVTISLEFSDCSWYSRCDEFTPGASFRSAAAFGVTSKPEIGSSRQYEHFGVLGR